MPSDVNYGLGRQIVSEIGLANVFFGYSVETSRGNWLDMPVLALHALLLALKLAAACRVVVIGG
jgi:hypothetical protein